jgi:anti-anti-sigma regulatory factor
LHRHQGWVRCPTIIAFEEQPSVLRCVGDEDLNTQPRRRSAFARAMKARADVVVDLSDLGWADPSLMVDLAMLARRLRGRGRRVVLRGAQPHIFTLIQTVGLHRLDGVELDRVGAGA